MLTTGPVVAHFVDRPPSLLAGAARRLFQRLATGGIDFPPTIFTPTSGPQRLDGARLAPIHGDDERLWIKRGDLRAAHPGDAIAIAPAEIDATLRAFAARGVSWVAVQKHVPGPVVRFHASTADQLFRWYPVDEGPPIDARAIERLVLAVADRLELEIFGGDVVLATPTRPVLIDLTLG